MIHTVYIDDSSIKGKILLENLQKESDVVSFEKPFVANASEYMTSSEFRTSVKKELANKLKADGRL